MNQLIRRGSGANLNLFRCAVMVVVLLLGVGNAWAGGSAYMSARSADPAQGLVYIATSNSAPTTDKYQEYYPGGCVVGTTGTDASPANKCYTKAGSGGGPHSTYAWAKPARGYKFKQWASGYATKMASENTQINTASDRSSWNGAADLIKTSAGGRQCTYYRPLAEFESATSYTITYAKPIGGSYTVGYSYLKTRERSTAKFYNASGTANAYKDYEFYTDNSESYSLSPSSDGNQAVTSYADDAITMTASGANFVGWYEGSTQKSTSASYTAYKANANVTITALFKIATLGTAAGDLSPAVKALGSNNYTITVPVTAHGSWSASDFTVTFAEQTSPARNDVTKRTVTYSQTSGNVLSSVGTLTIPFTYNPATWGNTDVLVTVTPLTGGVYGTAISFHILASATEPVTEEAQLWENGVKTQSGTLAAMVTAANALSTNPTVKLMQNKTIEAPLSLQKSMKFDLNDKKITSTGTSAFSIDAASIDVQIVDEGFGGNGEIATSSAQNGNVNVVTFTQKAKLTMQGGTLSATNTGSGSAYGINVTQGSTFYMTNGQLTVTGVSEAQGVHVATASDYATLNGGSITVTAPSNAYGVWSAGQSNVTGATIAAETTTGANAYGIYVNGGVSTLTTNTLTATAKTTNAFAAYVNAGRLNGNGGSFAAEAVTSGAYGVHVQAGATAVVQQNAVVTAESTGASGTSVFGVNNLGTVSLTNVSVTATSPTTAATAVNTATSATSTTIEGGTYRANTTGGTAYGLHHQYGTLNVDGGEFKAVGSGNSIYGARATVDATIANASIWGETQGSGNTAYGFVGGVANKNITLTNCTITGLSATSKAYAIYSRANVTATGCTLTATTTGTNEAYGLYAENGTNKLVNTDATVTSNTIQAYGINHLDGSLTIEGGRFEVTAEQKTAGAEEESKLYGVYNAANKTTTVSDAEFIVRATNSSYAKYMYGAYTLGTLNSTNTIYDVKGKVYARGIYNSGTLNLQNNTITAENTNGSDCYGIYATNKFTIDGDEVFAKSNLKTVYAMTFGASADGDVLAGKFYAMGNGTNDFGAITKTGTIGKVRLKGGVYKTAFNLQRYAYTGLSVFNLDDTHPDYAAGYRYTIAAENPSPYVCYIKNGNKYETLAAALQYTKDNSGNYIIVMSQNHTLPAGDYELPSNATLIVPYKTGQETLATAPIKRNTAGLIEEHIRLTLASGANLNVSGKIEVGGELYCVESGLISYNNSPYAHIRMEEGSLIQLNSGAKLYAWGFITGAGNITVKNNAEVHEMFQVGDMPAMSPLVQKYNNNSHKFFPLNQYFIQNIESPTTYYYGSKLICSFSNYYTGSYNGDDNIKLVGTESSLFLITSTDESSWVRKSYDAVHDYQVWEVNSDIKLGSLSLSISGYTFNSTKYILPVTSNMKIHVLDGDFAITQSTQFLPGTQVEVNKTASLKVNSGQKVYFFDKDQWSLSTKTIAFSPSWTNGNKPSRTSLFVDAALNVHGKINVEGSLFTSNKGTTTKTDGANIYSTNADAGTVSYNADAPSATTITLMTSADATQVVNMESAKLKNNDGSYSATASTASGEAWIYLNNVWQKTYTNGCFEVIGSTVYAKPSGYVALKKSQTDANSKLTGVEETNHTYLTADDKILILMDECQWWEVVATSDPAVFECKKEGYEGFYYYDNTTSKWKLKTVNVKFYSAETGDNVLKTIVTDYNGIPDQAVIANNPTKEKTAEFTYSFYGWKSSVTGTEYKWTDQLEVATADMSYCPVFTKTKRNYTITLVNANNGANVPLEVPYGETPEYTPKKDATAQFTHTFTGWTPAFTTVTGTATYTANWNSVVNEYNITWKNGNEILEVDENQSYGTATAFNGASLPTKDADDDYEYAFSKWKSSLNGNSYNNGSTPKVAGETTYEAQYTTTPRYAVTFNNYDGTQLARTIYTQGLTPSYDGVPARKRDADGYFKFIGWKNSNGTDYAANAVLPTVTKKETYTAQYDYVTDFFTITLKNVDGNGATWSGKFGEGSTPFYNPNEDDVPVIPTKTSADPKYSYVFNGWSLTSGGAKLDPTPAVTEDKTYWALFTQVENKYTVSFAANNDAWGIVSRDDVKEVPYGTSITVNGNTLTVNGKTITATPAAEDAQYMYIFERWDNVPATVTSATNIQAVFKAYVATVEAGGNTTYHTTIADAFTTANTKTNNPTVTMFKNVSIASEIEITKTMTIDLNGKTITATQASKTGVFKINASGKTVTITGGSNGQINHTASYNGYMYGINLIAGSFAMEGGAIYVKNTASANDSYRSIGIWSDSNAAAISLSGATIQAEGKNMVFGVYTNNNCDFSMTGGTITANGTTKIRAIYVRKTTTLTNATITATATSSNCYGIFVKTGTITIEGGTYTASATETGYTIYEEAGTVTINDGRFSGLEKELHKAGGTASLKGGVYAHNTDLAANCASGYQVFALTAAEKAEVGSEYNYKVSAIFTVTFNANGHGTAPQSQQVEKGKKATEPDALEATGYIFDGWYKEEGCANAWDFNSDVVNANTTLFAKWTPINYTITFDSNGGSAMASITQGYGTDVTAPAAPSKTGYTFNGWSPAVPSTMPLNGTTCVAQWTPNTNTAYTVEHYWQNIADNEYTKHETVNMTGTTDAPTAAVAKSYTGFEAALPFEQGTVAPDGSTVVKIYYNRKTYLIKWNVKLNGEQEAYKEETLRYGAMPSYGSTPAKEQTKSQVFTFSGWNPTPYAVDKAQTYEGSFNVSPRPYTITFVNDNGAELWHSDFGYGSTPSYGGTPVTPESTQNPAYTFAGWSPEITTVAGETTYTATYRIANIEVKADESKDVTVSASTNVTTVHVSGSLSIEGGKTLKTTTLVLEASPDGSGQISGNIDAEEAYLDYNLGSSQSGIWYDIAVPWEVDATNGVYLDDVQKQVNRDFYLIYYNGALRASENRHTDECWQFVGRESTPDNHMHPGRLYMIYLPKAGVNKLSFKRHGKGPIVTPAIQVYQYDADNVVNAGWNGIANPAIYKAYLNAGANTVEVGGSTARTLNYGQKYDPIHDRYDAFTMNNTKLNVSQPVFVQVEVNGNGTGRSVVVNASEFPNLAPVRKALVNNAAYEVQISDGTNYTDRLYLQSIDGKEDSYRIGLDLSKAGTSSKVAQMWINRYNSKLCVNTTAPVGTTANYPLGISVPSDGTYEITSATEMQDGQEMYVTYNGRAIWNLAYGPYAVTLNKGTYNEYGLKLVQKAPTITTGVETVSDERLEVSGVRKVLIDDHIYIIREGAVYTINGKQVK